ncbi:MULTISPECIES: hypothetical protein [unclassified Bradyrhizobium]|uniref:hypothetical protein n=1 Tax=unclassified Bradyrhizobium TaxID=2631580 RepID=UPI0024E0584B|nr:MULTISPECIES: hypothetical protein [unclassified Bradyrhizobium]
MRQTIAAAGNVEVPAYLTLIKLGYDVDHIIKGDYELWTAQNETVQLVADSPLQLLGLALLYRERGPDWYAADDEIEAFLARFCS